MLSSVWGSARGVILKREQRDPFNRCCRHGGMPPTALVPSVFAILSLTSPHLFPRPFTDIYSRGPGPPPGMPSKTSRRTVTRHCLGFVCHAGISRQRARCVVSSHRPPSPKTPGLDSRGFWVVCANFCFFASSLPSSSGIIERGLQKLKLRPKVKSLDFLNPTILHPPNSLMDPYTKKK